MTTWTVLDEQRPVSLEIAADGSLDPSPLGWKRQPEGLCRDEICIPVPAGSTLDLATLAHLLGRPVVIDSNEKIAALGASSQDRAAVLRSGIAPDFSLPDINGVTHRLSDHRGRKVVLYAYASW